MTESTDPRVKDIVDRYVAVWGEPDPVLRRKAVEELWTEDGEHILKPPLEIREAADRIGFPAVAPSARGHHGLDIRVSRTYDEFIAPGTFEFRLREGSADRLDDVVKFTWEMVPVGGGPVAGVGVEVLILGADGRIAKDYQFIEG